MKKIDEEKLKKYENSKKTLESLNYIMIMESEVESFGEIVKESWWLNPRNGIPLRLTFWQLRQAQSTINI